MQNAAGSMAEYQRENLILRIITHMKYFMLLNFSIFLFSFLFLAIKVGIKNNKMYLKEDGRRSTE